MEDSFSVRVKIETATNAVKKPVQRQTALCGLILGEAGDDLSAPIEEVKIPDRLSELLVHLFEEEGIKCSSSKGKIRLSGVASSKLFDRILELLSSISVFAIRLLP